MKVGAITKAVRNSARLTMTAFGGAVWVPIAERRSDSTTTIRVNDVTITRMEGASASTVTSATSWSARSVTPPPWPRSSVRVWASAVAADAMARSATAPAAMKRAGPAFSGALMALVQG